MAGLNIEVSLKDFDNVKALIEVIEDEINGQDGYVDMYNNKLLDALFGVDNWVFDLSLCKIFYKY